MKDILSLWLCQTLLLLVLKHITISYADDRRKLDDLARNYYYEEPNSYNRRGYGELDNVNIANHYEAAYADGVRRTNQQDSSGKTVSETKFTKPANLRKRLYSDMQSAYDTALGYGNTRNGDISEIEIAPTGASSAEKDVSNSTLESGLANNTVSSSSNLKLLKKSNFPKQSADSCNCESSGANEEVSFLCFSSKDGSKNLSIKYKGMTMFNLEDILKAYKFYYDNMQVHNYNFENILNSESNFKNEFEGDTKFNIDLSTFKINEGNFNLNSESKIDTNEIKKGANKFKVNSFDKFDMKTIKDGSNQFNFDFIKNSGQDIQKYLNENTQFEKNFNSNLNLETNAKMEAWKKAQDMAESKKNSFNYNQFSFNSDVKADAQTEFEAQAKALVQAKAIAKAQAILQAQAEAEAESKAQAVIKNQMVAQAQAEAQAHAMAEAQAESQFNAQSQSQAQAHAQAQAKAQAHAQAQAQAYAQTQSQSHAFSSSDANSNGRLTNGVKLGVGGLKKILGKGFSLGFGGGFGGPKFGASYAKQAGGAFSFGGGGGGGSIGFGSHGLGEKTILGGSDGLGIGTAMTYTSGDINYADALYDENSEDGYTGVLAYPAPNDSPIIGTIGSRYNDGYNQKDGFAFGVGYQHYP